MVSIDDRGDRDSGGYSGDGGSSAVMTAVTVASSAMMSMVTPMVAVTPATVPCLQRWPRRRYIVGDDDRGDGDGGGDCCDVGVCGADRRDGGIVIGDDHVEGDSGGDHRDGATSRVMTAAKATLAVTVVTVPRRR